MKRWKGNQRCEWLVVRSAVKQVFFPPRFVEDMDGESLTLAVRRNREYLDRLGPETVFHCGTNDFTLQQVRESQEAFTGLQLYILIKKP